MVDCENEVYTKVATALRTAYSGIDVSGVYEPTPSTFPHVCFYEVDNSMVQNLSSDTKEMASVTFEVNVYSNKKGSKKAEAKSILNTIDAIMFGLNAQRLSKLPVPNLNNASIYRLVARYRVLTDGTFFYRWR